MAAAARQASSQYSATVVERSLHTELPSEDAGPEPTLVEHRPEGPRGRPRPPEAREEPRDPDDAGLEGQACFELARCPVFSVWLGNASFPRCPLVGGVCPAVCAAPGQEVLRGLAPVSVLSAPTVVGDDGWPRNAL